MRRHHSLKVSFPPERSFDRSVIIWGGKKGPSACWDLSLTWLDVIPDDGHVIVTVGPRVLVPEADDVTQFVHHDAKFVTVLAYGDSLGPVATTTHIGTTPNKD